MIEISEADIRQRIERDNPWWGDPNFVIREAALQRRVYFGPFKTLALNPGVQRAAVLLGPRRVGKTVILRQLIHEARTSGIDPRTILYASVDAPVYSRVPLEKFLEFLPAKTDNGLIIFDEIQYLKDWEVHLKDLVDNHPGTKFIVSGSAAAALKLKSIESGAGRFSDFMLPPLTFYEFLCFTGDDEKLVEWIPPKDAKSDEYRLLDVDALNERFIDYLNYGGYPEAVLNPDIRQNAEQFIRSDIIDKVLLKDLPSLYGIAQIPELNRLFTVLAYNVGNEVSLDNISRTSGISKPTISRYIKYLESAFLIIKLPTVDDVCKTLKRERNFKVYLNNPSMHAALFSPVRADEPDKIGHLAECALFSQWQHSPASHQLRYARWKDGGEVDVVYLSAYQKPSWIGEVKWSDRIGKHFWEEVAAMEVLLGNHKSINATFFTTKTISREDTLMGRPLHIRPIAFQCYMIGRNITSPLNEIIGEVAAKAAA
jgi:predicted AAA+ superfamily ATPase